MIPKGGFQHAFDWKIYFRGECPMKWIVPPCADLIEPSVAPEYYVEDIGGIEWASGNIRMHWICEQMPLGAGEPVLPSRPVIVKLICPIVTTAGLIGHLAQCLRWPRVDSPAPLQPPRWKPHMVR